MAYTTTTLVTNEIGTDYDSTTDLTTAHVTAFLAQADGLIDGARYEHYNEFNATAGTPATPALIAQCSKNIALAMCLRQLRARGSGSILDNRIDEAATLGELALDQLRAGEFVKTETQSTETLSFGDGSQSWELGTDEAFVASTSPLDSGDPPHILKDTFALLSTSTVDGSAGFTAAELADMRIGREYRVTFRPEYRRWVFKALDSGRINSTNVTTFNVTYDWDYRKDFRNEAHRSGVVWVG